MMHLAAASHAQHTTFERAAAIMPAFASVHFIPP
jgi:hypothetical protein